MKNRFKKYVAVAILAGVALCGADAHAGERPAFSGDNIHQTTQSLRMIAPNCFGYSPWMQKPPARTLIAYLLNHVLDHKPTIYKLVTSLFGAR